jgi:serine phosphatase RsbU (regulator of sigma subunit)/anti-sigma regulatory factor (Ser/Thr protein kinase)
MAISATIGAGTLLVSGAIDSDELLAAWAVWWTGDAMGVLAVAPFLLSLPLFWELKDWRWTGWAEEAAILAVVAGVSLWAALSDLHLLFLTLPVLGWAAWRHQLRGAAPAALITSLVATWTATRERGEFGAESLFERMLTLQAFNASVALTSFFLAALVSERMRAADQLVAAAAELETRVQVRTAELSAANTRLLQEIHERSEAEEQLSREEERAQKEHQIAETLQRSLLPDRLPEIPGVRLAARYLPATTDVRVGGDWYDVVQLRDGLVGLAIGDVAGHGIQAAATMGQLRMALRVYALQDPAPATVLQGVHQLVSQLPMPEMVTLMYLVYDPATRQVRFTNAGHPPALVVANGQSTYLADGLTPPVGVTADDQYIEAGHVLPVGATLLLYTDGLIERRGVSIQKGLDRLSTEAATQETTDLEALCDGLLSSLVDPTQIADDIALVAMRPDSLIAGPLRINVPAEPRMLAQLRVTLRRWLRESGVAPTDENEIVVACGEACANVVQHAYEVSRGAMTLEAQLVGESVELSVRDFGQWRVPAERGGGWGISLMKALMDTVEIEHGPRGTEIRMTRGVHVGGGG